MTNDRTELLRQLIGCPTISNRPVDALAAILANRAEDAGGRVESIETAPGKRNLVARFGPPSPDGLIISGHMDVVPTEGQPWSSDPFRLTARDGQLFGRGTADMKGFIATITAALPALPLAHLRRELVLIWTHDEEVGCLGSQSLAREYAEPLPRHAWIGEPTGFEMCRMHPGHTTVRIHCTGRAAHSSRPGLGFNAIQLAGRVLTELETLANHWRTERRFEEHLEAPFTVMNIGEIHGGTAVNIVPDQCTIRVGFRPLPGDDSKPRVDAIVQCLAAVKRHAQFGGGDVVVETEQTAPALLTQSGSRLERALCGHAAHPAASAAPFATDGGNFQTMGIECMVFGPGAIDVAHKADEHINPADLARCESVAVDLVQQFCIADRAPA